MHVRFHECVVIVGVVEVGCGDELDVMVDVVDVEGGGADIGAGSVHMCFLVKMCIGSSGFLRYACRRLCWLVTADLPAMQMASP